MGIEAMSPIVVEGVAAVAITELEKKQRIVLRQAKTMKDCEKMILLGNALFSESQFAKSSITYSPDHLSKKAENVLKQPERHGLILAELETSAGDRKPIDIARTDKLMKHLGFKPTGSNLSILMIAI